MKKHYDFSKSKRGAVVSTPHKVRICIRLDANILEWFKNKVAEGGNYQTLINHALRDYIDQHSVSFENMLRKIIREELSQLH